MNEKTIEELNDQMRHIDRGTTEVTTLPNQTSPTSPVPQIVDAATLKNRPIKLTFPRAMEVVVACGKVRRLGWPDDSPYVTRNEGYLRLVHPDGKMNDLILTDGDMLSDDWVEVK